MSEPKEKYNLEGDGNPCLRAPIVFTRKTLVGALMNGFPCAICPRETFITGDIYPGLKLFLCGSCDAPMCFACFDNCQRIAEVSSTILCQYCAKTVLPCSEVYINDPYRGINNMVYRAHVACNLYLRRFQNRINLRNPNFDYSKLIWAKKVNENWRKLLELEQLFAHQHPAQIRILVAGLSPLSLSKKSVFWQRAHRLSQEYFWGFYPELRVKSLLQSMVRFLIRPSKHCRATWSFCFLLQKRVQAGCANHFANRLGVVEFMKDP